MSRPIEDYALIGDGQTAALVSRDGSIDWLCLPRFDDDACFSAILGNKHHGRWLLAPAGEIKSKRRRYEPDTLVMESEFTTDGGVVRMLDFMPMRQGNPSLVRILQGVSGRVEIGMELRLRFDYGTIPPLIEAQGDGFTAKIGPDLVVLHSPVPVGIDQCDVSASFEISGGERRCFVLRYGPSNEPPPGRIDADEALRSTRSFWRDWIGRFDNSRTHWPDALRRSLITLKALVHEPTGGLVAAPTTSLPEAPGGTMNWDYRYSWLRDSTFMLGTFVNAGYCEEARRWRDWLLRAVGGTPGGMRIMYRVDGSRHLTEWEIALPGYRYAKPVRIGNAAATQHQIDVYGEVLDTLALGRKVGLDGSDQLDFAQKRIVEHLAEIWNGRGSGLWESRSEPRHYTYSKAMAWVGVDRFLREYDANLISPEDRALAGRLRTLRREIHEDICREGWNEGRQSFTQYYGGQELDASLLLLPLIGFLPVSDPRIASTIEAIRRELSEGGLIRRKAAPADGPKEGTFLACSCWMADCLHLQGRDDEARAQFERVLAVCNDLGLLSEEYDVPGRHLSGNFPQALTHLAVVTTGLTLSGPVIWRHGR